MGATVFGSRIVAFAIIALGLLFAQPRVATAQACENFDQIKQRLYSVYIAAVAQDIRAIPNADDETLRANLAELARSYMQKTQFGDFVYWRKLMGIGMFTAAGANGEPPDGTFRLACTLAQTSPQVLEALTCAAIALDGARRFHPNSKGLVRRMMTVAREKLETDRDPNAQKLVDTAEPVLLGCVAD